MVAAAESAKSTGDTERVVDAAGHNPALAVGFGVRIAELAGYVHAFAEAVAADLVAVAGTHSWHTSVGVRVGLGGALADLRVKISA